MIIFRVARHWWLSNFSAFRNWQIPTFLSEIDEDGSVAGGDVDAAPARSQQVVTGATVEDAEETSRPVCEGRRCADDDVQLTNLDARRHGETWTRSSVLLLWHLD